MRRVTPMLCGAAAGALAWTPLLLLVALAPRGLHALPAAAAGAALCYGLFHAATQLAATWPRLERLFWVGFAHGALTVPLLASL